MMNPFHINDSAFPPRGTLRQIFLAVATKIPNIACNNLPFGARKDSFAS